ncbi:TPA: hypothetical protein DCZ81_01150 [Candidatus Collierbacteria bacterium]|nr:hypothetical protein [Candidatus Collierbacteria bacterium]
MKTDFTADGRYKFVRVRPTVGEKEFAAGRPRINPSLVIEAFVSVAVGSSKIPVKILHPDRDEWVSLPISEYGKTMVRWAGKNPPVVGDRDEYGNLTVKISEQCALEVIFNRVENEKGARGKKLIYVVK